MANSTVKWFNNAKGFGFIRPKDGGEDVFAYYTIIKMNGFCTLKAGQNVRYEIKKGPKGFNALSKTLEGPS